MNQPATEVKRGRGRPRKEAPPPPPPNEYIPYGAGSILRVSKDSPVLKGKVVVVVRYLDVPKSYACHEKGHEARTGYVSRDHIAAAVHIVPLEARAERRVMLRVPAQDPADRERVESTKIEAPAPSGAPTEANGINFPTLKLIRYARNAPTKTSRTEPVLSFNSVTIGINGVALAAIGSPHRTHILFDAAQNVVAIEAADKNDKNALKVQYSNPIKRESGNITTTGFYAACGLEPPKKPVRVPATVHGGRVMAVFPSEPQDGGAASNDSGGNHEREA